MDKSSPVTVLIAFDSRGGLIEQLAQAIAVGVDSAPGARAVLKRIDDCTREDLFAASALILGSPNWSGITGKMKAWMDGLGDLWAERQMEGKIGAAFTAGASRSAGIEFTLLTLIHWMLANGMLIAGLPWTESLRDSGSYYGATATGAIRAIDLELGRQLGARVAELARRNRV